MENKTKIEEVRKNRRLKKKQLAKLEKNQMGLNQIIKPFIFFIVSFALELTSFLLFKFKTTSGSAQILPKYILIDIAVWLIISALILLPRKNWLSNLIFYIALFVEAVIFLVNVVIYKDFGYLFTFDMVKLIPGAMESMHLSFLSFKLILFAVLGLIIFISAPLVVDKIFKKKKFAIKNISKSVFCLLIFLIVATVGAGCYTAQVALIKTSATNTEISDDKYLYNNQQIYDQYYQKFGSCGFYIKNLTSLLFPNSNISDSELEDIIKDYDSNLATRRSTLREDNNLIIIMMESFEWFAIDPYNTPNLWALKTGTASDNVDFQATVFSNYNSNNKTNVSENLCMLGYMPSENIFSVKSDNVYATKYSLANLFNAQGYTTSFFHNWNINFYNRKNTNTNIGFKNIYSLEDFQSNTKSTKFNYYNLEADFVDQFIEKIAPTTGEKFMSFYTTVSSHGTYDVINPRFENYYTTYDNNLEKLKTWFASNGYHYPETEDMQAVLREYKSATMDTDVMVGKIFKHLKDNNLLDTTTVVLYADHNAYYQDLTNEVKSTDKSDYSSQTSYTVPLMIYSKTVPASTIDSYCSPYDLYPTISGLFGLQYNLYNAQGKDILSPTEISQTVYMSHLTGFYSSKCYSKNMMYIQKYDGATDTDIQNFKDNVCKVLEKQRILNIVYRSNKTY